MWVRRHRFLAQAMVAFAVMCFTAPAFAAGSFAGRISPTQKIDFFRDGNRVGQYTAEAPLPWDTRVQCTGRAGVRMDHMSVVLEDGSAFVVSQRDGGSALDLQKGTAYFALTNLPDGLTFATPQGSVMPELMTLHASTGNQVLKGYVKVGDKQSELGVLEGGSLMVRTADGNQTIKSGEHIVLAQAKLGEKGSSGGGNAVVGGLTGTDIAVIGVGLAAFTGMAIAGADDDDDEGSPFTPPQ